MPAAVVDPLRSSRTLPVVMVGGSRFGRRGQECRRSLGGSRECAFIADWRAADSRAMSAARLFIFALLSLAVLHAEEPFAFEKTPGKLPKDVVPVEYILQVEPDVERATLSGWVWIQLDVRRPVRRIVLNSLGLTITRAVLTAGREIALVPQLDAVQQTLAFDLEQELPAGPCSLQLTYTGTLSEAPQGLYIARYQSGTETRRALATQMEATDARRMFPCWDEPVFRAKFTLKVIVPKEHMALSNMPVRNEKVREDGRKVLVFEETPPMASYLVALCIGEFEELRDEVDGVQLRVVTTAGKREQGRYAMEATKKILAYFNEYFGVKYPLPKLDQIALAATGASGMENWGLITYSENALLFDPAKSSQSTRERVFGIVAHELAHQWFGDLVTMAWWDNLWLNEGFASWMGTKAVDRFNPEWKVWLRAAGEREWAMWLDARATTHPIQQRVETESQAMDAFDEITYQKGQSLLRMVESWLGEDVFREGIRAYMKRHAYSSTTTADLWRALEEASGKPVQALAAGWTEQPGFPVVKVEPDAAGVRLVQERFTINQKSPAPLKWQVPVRVERGGESRMVLLGAEPQAVALGGDAPAIVNAGAIGYFRAAYGREHFAALVKAAPTLAEADRLTLLNDTWALVLAERAPLSDYLDLATALSRDEAYVIADQIADTIASLDRTLRGAACAEEFRKWARALLAPHLARLGWDSKPGESPLDTQLRTSLLHTLGALADAGVVAEAQRRFAAFLKDARALDGNLRGPVFTIVGRNADEATYEQLHALGKAEDGTEQKRTLYGALCHARTPDLARKTLALALGDELPPKESARLVGRVASEAELPEMAWEFARTHLDALLARLPAFSANDYVPGIFRAFSDAARADELEAFAKASLPPAVAAQVAKAADEIRFKAALKARLPADVDAWLRKRAEH